MYMQLKMSCNTSEMPYWLHIHFKFIQVSDGTSEA